jgi:hypothetical protein
MKIRKDRTKKKAKRDISCSHLEGVVTFFGSHHALRAEKVLTASGFEAVLIPGPREISPNCGVALRFDYGESHQCEQILHEKSVQIEAIHHYPEQK